jgi:hypothetical protein
MSISIFDPITGERRGLNAGSSLSMTDLLLLNVLIELQAIGSLIADQTPGPLFTDVEALRGDIANN